MNMIIKTLAITLTLTAAGMASAGTGLADRINEARTYPFKTAGDAFLASESHRKVVQLVKEIHKIDPNSVDQAKRDELHEQLHRELELHAVR
ncbi:hypothetical protein [Allohahella sp. A8]|uniref:hypothetical protein n=1 Tax=Allohahella sp. A8 TaxID=3141461 RepID=UPI000C0964B8|nr:hypothetical protein [Hahellaceae bacterium]|tara:strand:- start:6954 stop:7229 length:276 start_codon:yes stop_codon:yes gene_type:complete